MRAPVTKLLNKAGSRRTPLRSSTCSCAQCGDCYHRRRVYIPSRSFRRMNTRAKFNLVEQKALTLNSGRKAGGERERAFLHTLRAACHVGGWRIIQPVITSYDSLDDETAGASRVFPPSLVESVREETRRARKR